MKNNYYILFTIVLVVLAGFIFSQSFMISQNESDILATIYKSPSCGCCDVYSSYMNREGYKINLENSQNMLEVKERFNIPRELESCHTTEIEGYIIEGHVPNEAIQKLLSNRPSIKGIGMPGMPTGSPGMPGIKSGDFIIYEINNDGTKGDVFMNI